MTRWLSPHWAELRREWDEGLGWEVRRSAAAFGILIILSFAACMLLPSLRERLTGFLLQMMGQLSVTDDAGNLSALALLANNTRVCAVVMLYGLVPFVRLPALSLGSNALLLGILSAWHISGGGSVPLLLAALLPHGILELPALILAFGVGLYACGQMSRRVRGDETARSLSQCLALMGRALAVMLPLLVLAAATEAYVTPAVASLFL